MVYIICSALSVRIFRETNTVIVILHSAIAITVFEQSCINAWGNTDIALHVFLKYHFSQRVASQKYSVWSKFE